MSQELNPQLHSSASFPHSSSQESSLGSLSGHSGSQQSLQRSLPSQASSVDQSHRILIVQQERSTSTTADTVADKNSLPQSSSVNSLNSARSQSPPPSFGTSSSGVTPPGASGKAIDKSAGLAGSNSNSAFERVDSVGHSLQIETSERPVSGST